MFWRLTLREVDLVLTGAARRIEREESFMKRGAWETARLAMIGFHKPSKFPEFSDFVKKPARPVGRRQSVEQLKALARMMAASMGARGPGV